MSKRKTSPSGGRKAAQPRGGRRPLLFRAASGFVHHVINAAAYSLRIFLRIRLGERAIGLTTVLLSYVWVCYFWANDYALELPQEDQSMENEWFKIPDVIKPFIVILSFIGQILLKAFNAFVNAGYGLGLLTPEKRLDIARHDFIILYSTIILFFGIVHLIKIQIRATSKMHVHSYTHGKSVFFWWLEGRKVPWFRRSSQTGKMTLKNVFIVEKTIFTYIEPLFVICMGLIFKSYGQDHIGWCLIFSALALFWDERRESVRFRGQVLDMLDGELEGQDLIEEYRKIKGEDEQGGDFERGARIPT
ncbi:MAG: hypothetical protein AAFZ15_24905 [Bacteroidota bacterium]